MKKLRIAGVVLALLGISLMVVPCSTHVLDVPLRAPEIQFDRDEMWEYDAAMKRQAVSFFTGCAMAAVGIYMTKTRRASTSTG
jgi:hypothetical protein